MCSKGLHSLEVNANVRKMAYNESKHMSSEHLIPTASQIEALTFLNECAAVILWSIHIVDFEGRYSV